MQGISKVGGTRALKTDFLPTFMQHMWKVAYGLGVLEYILKEKKYSNV
jgi:hypothetical protein